MGTTMNPSERDTQPGLAPASQLACYGEWLKVSVALRHALSHQWSREDWAEVRRHIPWLLAERSRIQREGYFN